MDTWENRRSNEWQKLIAFRANDYEGFESREHESKWRGDLLQSFLGKLWLSKTLEEVREDRVRATNGRLTFICCYKGPRTHLLGPMAYLLGPMAWHEPTKAGKGRGPSAVSLLRRLDPFFHHHPRDDVGTDCANLTERSRAEETWDRK